MKATLKRVITALPPTRALHSRVRAGLQERAAAGALRAYGELARAQGIPVLDGQALRDALRARLAARPHPRWPKAQGALHIFLMLGVYDWERVLARGLEVFGRVTLFDWHAHGAAISPDSWPANRDVMNRQLLQAFERAHAEQPVDAVIGIVNGLTVAPAVLRTLAARGPAIFNLTLDDKLGYGPPNRPHPDQSLAAVVPFVDLSLTNAPASRVMYAVDGGLSLFLPEAAHPEVHRPHALPFDVDVSFIGRRYGAREPFLTKLQHLLRRDGVRLQCFGPGWPSGPLSDDGMVALYSRSRVNLGFGGVGHSLRLTCLKGRDFEVPMSGGLYLTQDNPELAEVFTVGEEILTYRDVHHCAAQIRSVLADPTRAAAIRGAGRARCLRDHSYEARWRTPLQLAGLLA
ncbi:MAG: glycosyltransferase [Polyangiales bacterium]